MRRLLRMARHRLMAGGSLARVLYLRLAYREIQVGFDTRIGPGCEISAGRGSSMVLRGASIGRGCQIIAAPGAVLHVVGSSIGPHSVVVAREAIMIGQGSMLAEMVVVRDADHDRPDGSPLRAQYHVTAPVVIGRDVWIAARATVLRGVTVGDRATVGAAAVVTRPVAADTTVVGVPARPLSTVALP